MNELTIPEPTKPITAAELNQLWKVIANILPSIEDIKYLDEQRARARALEQYLRDKELQGPMLGAQRMIEARIGQLLPDQGRSDDGKFTVSLTTETGNIAKDDREDFKILAHAFNGVALSESEWCKSRRALIALIRQKLGLIPPTPELPEGIFRLIVADPPWTLDTGPDTFGGKIEKGHDALKYTQMSVDAICDLPVGDHVAEDAHLYLWTTNKYIEHSYQVARAWGFKPSVLLVWAKKPHGVGLGDAYRLTTEFILYARKGSLKELHITNTTWFSWPRSRHSVKPQGFYDLVEKMTPAPHGKRDRLELFARQKRDQWTVWGNEVG